MTQGSNLKPKTNSSQSWLMIEHTLTITVVPMGAPRMTRRDKWARRPAVLRYHAFKDKLRLAVNRSPVARQMVESGKIEALSWNAWLPLPDSWSKRKKTALAGELHRQKPDRDNIDKAILDALFDDDSGIASGAIEKRWDDGQGPRIELHFIAEA